MEWQDEFDVNVYDFGARNYDPALGRWMNIDPPEIVDCEGMQRGNTPIPIGDSNGSIGRRQSIGSKLNPATVKRNIPLFGGRSTYAGGNNPTTFSGEASYEYVPDMITDYPAIGHDRRYDNLGASGASSVFFDTRTIGADWHFVKEQFTMTTISLNPSTKINSFILGAGMALGTLPKTIYQFSKPNGLGVSETILWYNISNHNVSNKPSP